MKKVLGILFAVLLVASVASAELLTTANPLGQGKWAVLGAGVQDANQQGAGFTGLTVTTYGGYVGYGVTNKADVYLTVGSGTVSGFPATVAGFSTAGVAASMTTLGLTAKYQVMDEMANSPVSVAVGAGYKTFNNSQTAPTILGGATTTSTSSQIQVGVGVSKIMAPFVPYGGIAYRSNASGSTTTSTQLDLTVGSAIAWSTQGAVFAEYTSQSITPNGGSAYTSGQMALGVGYSI